MGVSVIEIGKKTVPPSAAPRYSSRRTPRPTPDTTFLWNKATPVRSETKTSNYKPVLRLWHPPCASSTSIVSILSIRSLELHLVISLANSSSLSEKSSAWQTEDVSYEWTKMTLDGLKHRGELWSWRHETKIESRKSSLSYRYVNFKAYQTLKQ